MTDRTRHEADDRPPSTHSRPVTVLGLFGWVAFALIGVAWLSSMADGLGWSAHLAWLH